jgi:hypothetical protein
MKISELFKFSSKLPNSIFFETLNSWEVSVSRKRLEFVFGKISKNHKKSYSR